MNKDDMSSIDFLKYLHTIGIDRQFLGECTSTLIDYLDGKPKEEDVLDIVKFSKLMTAPMLHCEFKGKTNVTNQEILNKFKITNSKLQSMLGSLRRCKKAIIVSRNVHNFV